MNKEPVTLQLAILSWFTHKLREEILMPYKPQACCGHQQTTCLSKGRGRCPEGAA